MPSRYSSEGSLTDAEEMCRRIGCGYTVRSIEAGHDALSDDLDETLRARRGVRRRRADG